VTVIDKLLVMLLGVDCVVLLYCV